MFINIINIFFGINVMKEWPYKTIDGKKPYVYGLYLQLESGELTEKDVREQFLNQYFRGSLYKGLPNIPDYEHSSIMSVVEMDENSRMYNQQFNPVDIYFTTLTKPIFQEDKGLSKREQKKKKKKLQSEVVRDKYDRKLYSFTCHIFSRDDGSFTAYSPLHQAFTRKHCLGLRTAFLRWFNSHPLVSASSFESFSFSLGLLVDYG